MFLAKLRNINNAAAKIDKFFLQETVILNILINFTQDFEYL